MITERDIIRGMRKVRRELSDVKALWDEGNLDAACAHAEQGHREMGFLWNALIRARLERRNDAIQALPVPGTEGLPDHLS